MLAKNFLLYVFLLLLVFQPLNCNGSSASQEADGFRAWPMWSLFVFCAITIVLSAMYCGLTIGLLGTDTITLEIIAEAGPEPDCRYARRILPVRKLGHQLLCTLLLGNMLTLVLTSQLIAAIVRSTEVVNFIVGTVVILIFGEIIPISYCNTGKSMLLAGSKSLPALKVSLFVLYPFAKPLGMLLDCMISHDAGQLYDRKKLKKMIRMYCEKFSDQTGIDQDQVRMMVSALEMNETTVDAIMTHIEKIVMLEGSLEVTPNLIKNIWECGKSRIPIYAESRENIIGVLYVKDLINVSSITNGSETLTLRDVVTRNPRDFFIVGRSTRLQETLNIFERGKTQILFVEDTHLSFASVSSRPGLGPSSAPKEAGSAIAGSEAAVSSTAVASPAEEVLTIETMSSAPIVLSPERLLRSGSTAPYSFIGILTLEDVIEALIASEIYDEDEMNSEWDTSDDHNDSVLLRLHGAALKRPPRVNFYSFSVDERLTEAEDVLSVDQKWALAGYLTRSFVLFASWSMPQIMFLLNDVPDQRVIVPATTEGETPPYPSSRVLYAANQESKVFTLLLSGSVQLQFEKQSFQTQLNSFSSLGDEVLSLPVPFTPDYTAVVSRTSRLLRISHDDIYRVENKINSLRAGCRQPPVKLSSFDVVGTATTDTASSPHHDGLRRDIIQPPTSHAGGHAAMRREDERVVVIE